MQAGKAATNNDQSVLQAGTAAGPHGPLLERLGGSQAATTTHRQGLARQFRVQVTYLDLLTSSTFL